LKHFVPLVLGSLAVIAACPPPKCAPGTTAGCSCPDALPGMEICQSTGAFASCVCTADDAGPTVCAVADGGNGGVVTQHSDNGRTGVFPYEAILTPAAVGARGMQVKYTAAVDDDIDGQPLYMRAVAFNGGPANAFFVVTQSNTAYAFDADLGALEWRQSLVDSDPGARPLAHGLTNPPVTPAIDASSNAMYVVFSTKNQAVDTAGSTGDEATLEATLDVAYWLVALDVRTGIELRRTQVTASMTRTDGTSLVFDARRQVNHPALLLDHGSVYVAFGSHWLEGVAEFHGWVIRYDAATFRAQGAFCTTIDNRGATTEGGGIWQGGGGLAADAEGNIYFLVGNATTDPANHSYGDSFVKLIPNGDTLTFGGSVSPPPDVASVMDAKDLDLGSGGPLVVPGTHLVIGGGKTGMLYVVDGATMSMLQSFQAFTNTYHPDWNYGCPSPAPADCSDWSAGPHLHGSPTYWPGPNPSFGYFYAWSEKDSLKQFKLDLTTSRMDETPVVGSVRATETLMPSPLHSLSSDCNVGASGVLWAVVPDNGPSHLYAFDADTLAGLWDAWLPAATPTMSHHAAPTVADGKLAIATASGAMIVYELGPPQPGPNTPHRPRSQVHLPKDPPGPPYATRYKDERSISALPALRRAQLTPPRRAEVLFKVRSRVESESPGASKRDGPVERFDGGRRLGNTWEFDDGSRLTAEEVRSVPAPERGLPVWQLFRVTTRQGRGGLTLASWIMRINTQEKSATYIFLGEK
jgi:hypothetical protein